MTTNKYKINFALFILSRNGLCTNTLTSCVHVQLKNRVREVVVLHAWYTGCILPNAAGGSCLLYVGVLAINNNSFVSNRKANTKVSILTH